MTTTWLWLAALATSGALAPPLRAQVQTDVPPLVPGAKPVAGRRMDGLSLHYYRLPTGNWRAKGSATSFGGDQWFSTLKRTLRDASSRRWRRA
jgi:hypothetical protein